MSQTEGKREMIFQYGCFKPSTLEKIQCQHLLQCQHSGKNMLSINYEQLENRMHLDVNVMNSKREEGHRRKETVFWQAQKHRDIILSWFSMHLNLWTVSQLQLVNRKLQSNSAAQFTSVRQSVSQKV